MKRIYPLIAFLFISYFSFAQYENFDLSKYKLPDIKRHQLDLSFDLNNEYRNTDLGDNLEELQSNFNQRLDLGYNFFHNSKILQRNYSVFLVSDFEMSKENQYDGLVKKSRDYYLNLNSRFNNRWYLNEDKLFIHLRPGLRAYYGWDKNKRKNLEQKEKTIAKHTEFSPSLHFGLGSGRIEPVGDLRHALYIANEFEKNDIANKVLSEEEVYEIATKISQLKNRRFFDSRIRRMYELSSLDSLFQSMDILTNNGVGYFTILNDIWLYGDEERFSGNRIQFDILTEWNYFKDRQLDELVFFYDRQGAETSQTHKTKYAELGAELTFDSFKPLGLKWQREISCSTSFEHRTKADNGDLDYEVPASNHYNFTFKYAYQWFMNTRTSASFGCNGRYSQSDYVDGGSNSEEYYASLFGNVYYYFSPRLRFAYGINGHYGIIDGDNNLYDNRFEISNRLTLNYAIF